jgi:uncharacterized delta-60 repeat protein
MKTTLLFGGFILCILSPAVFSQNMIPDTLFGTFSNLQVSPGAGDAVSDFLLQTDTKIICGGTDYDGSQNDFHIDMVRFDNCGDIDSSFGTDGIVHVKFDQRSMGYSFKFQEDNKILCGGQQAPSNAGSQQIPCISRFNEDGSVDMTFNGSGFNSLRYDDASSGSFNSVSIMPDDRILCIGTCSGNANGGVNGIGLMRFSPDGTLDPTFSGDGKVVFSDAIFTAFGMVHGHLLQSGRIIAVASTWDASYIDHFFAMAFDSTGAVDPTFGNGGFFTDTVPLVVYGNIMGTALQADDKVLLMANRTSGNGIEVIRIKPDGIIDSTFGTYGHSNFNFPGMAAKRVTVLSDGKIMVIGGNNSGYGVGCGVRLNADGSVDTTFGTDGFMIFDLNNNSGTHYLSDMLDVSPEHWLVGGATNNFLIRKYTDLSNVPHISLSENHLLSSGTGTFNWYFEGTEIPGENGNVITPSQNGMYSVEITDNSGCKYMSDPFEVNNVGIDEKDLYAIRVYPNPFSDNLHISIEKDEPAEIILYDLTSRIVIDQGFMKSVFLETQQLPKGLYFYEILNKSGVLGKGKVIAE